MINVHFMWTPNMTFTGKLVFKILSLTLCLSVSVSVSLSLSVPACACMYYNKLLEVMGQLWLLVLTIYLVSVPLLHVPDCLAIWSESFWGIICLQLQSCCSSSGITEASKLQLSASHGSRNLHSGWQLLLKHFILWAISSVRFETVFFLASKEFLFFSLLWKWILPLLSQA